MALHLPIAANAPASRAPESRGGAVGGRRQASSGLAAVGALAVTVLILAAGAQPPDSTDAQRDLALANRHFSDSLYPLAAGLYRKYLTEDRDTALDADVRYRIAVCRMRSGDTAAAAASGEDFLDRYPLDPRSTDALLMAAAGRETAGEFGAASSRYREVWMREGGSPRGRIALLRAALCCERAGDSAQALALGTLFLDRFGCGEDADQVRRAVGRLAAWSGADCRMLARCLRQVGDSAAAAAQLLELAGVGIPARQLACAAVERGGRCVLDEDTAGALAWYSVALGSASCPDSGLVWSRTGMLHVAAGRFARAAAAFGHAFAGARTVQDSGEALCGEVLALSAAGRFAEADRRMPALKRLLRSAPGDPAVLVYRAGLRTLMETDCGGRGGRFEAAVSRFPRVLREEAAAFRAALCLAANGRAAEAQAGLAAFIIRYAGSSLEPQARFAMAVLARQQGDHGKAAALFSGVAGDSAANAEVRFDAWAQAAACHQKTGAWAEAAAMYCRMIGEFGDRLPASAAAIKAGFALAQSSRYREAISYFAEADRDPTPEEKPEILYWLATCRARAGDVRGAVAGLRLVPLYRAGLGQWAPTADFEAARLCERSGDTITARQLYGRVVRIDGEKGELGKRAARRLQEIGAAGPINTTTAEPP